MSVADRLDILEVLARYSAAWDGRDFEAYAALFTEDAVFELNMGYGRQPLYRHEGRKTIRAWARETHAGHLARVLTRHFQTGTVFDELTPASARTRTLLLETRMHHGDERPIPWVTGVYHDTWRKVDGRWLIARREHHIDYVRRPRAEEGGGAAAL